MNENFDRIRLYVVAKDVVAFVLSIHAAAAVVVADDGVDDVVEDESVLRTVRTHWSIICCGIRLPAI